MRLLKLILGLVIVGVALGLYCNQGKCSSNEKNPLTVLTEKGFQII